MPDPRPLDTDLPTAPAATAVVAMPAMPRWEARWIEETLPIDPAVLARWSAAAPAASEESYFVSFRTPHNVKVRRGLLEVKRLLQLSDDGLELWTPVLKSPFSLPRDAFTTLCAAWGTVPPVSLPDPLSLAELQRYVDRDPDLRHVAIIKRRRRVEHAGCPGEFTEITMAGQRWMSVAFEHEDPTLVRAALARLGLDPRRALNYPAALKRLFLRQGTAGHAVEGAP